MRERILLVEGDESLGGQIVGHLREAGYNPAWVQDGEAAMEASLRRYDLVILEIILPGAYGLDILKRLRSRSDLPVLILSDRDETADKVRSLELGADDFLARPFSPEELLARIQARLRRPGLQRHGIIRVDGIAIDVERRHVEVKGKPVDLTRAEFDLLAALARRRGGTLSRSHLVDAALDPLREGTERTLDVHVSRIRKKLGSAGWRIATVRGVGYRLEVEDGLTGVMGCPDEPDR